MNIYGSQDAFIEVYKSMLEERILQNPNISYETELKNLELMKLRFGEQNLHKCEVMLRDIKDSERINREVQKMKKNSKGAMESSNFDVQKLYVKVVSTGYWQNFKDDDEAMMEDDNSSDQLSSRKPAAKLSEGFAPDKVLKTSFDEFVDFYKKYKSLRTLYFKQDLGSVDLTLTFLNGPFNFKATPLEAAVIGLFSSEHDAVVSLTFDQMMAMLSNPNCNHLAVKSADLKKCLSHWVCLGVIHQEQANMFKSVSFYEPKKNSEEPESVDPDEQSSIYVQHHHKHHHHHHSHASSVSSEDKMI